MAVINSLQSRPRNRFVSGYNLTRGVLGAALWVIAILSASKIEEEGWAAWILPSMAFAYGIGVGVDWVILHFCVQSIRNMESLSPQLPPLPYDHEQSQQLESSPAGTDIQGQKGSSDLVDAAGREKGELHREKSESSFV
ncbi:hypothetical protein FRC01_005478 [Tulasnella sp. 417]|nr:hypothetical protein FRC01_005478 [Tulasnella sp. 417]